MNRENDRESTSGGLPVDTARMQDHDESITPGSNDSEDKNLKRKNGNTDDIRNENCPVVDNDTDDDDNNTMSAVSPKQRQESKNVDSTMAPPLLQRHSNVLQRMTTPGAYPSDQQQHSGQQLPLPPSSPLDTVASNHPVTNFVLRRNQSNNRGRNYEQYHANEQQGGEGEVERRSLTQNSPRHDHPNGDITEPEGDTLPILEATLVTSQRNLMQANDEQDIPAPVLLVAHVSDEVILAQVIPSNNSNGNNDDEQRKKHQKRSRDLYILVAMFAFCITVVSCVLITLRVQEDDDPPPLGRPFGCDGDRDNGATHCDKDNMANSCDHGNRCSNYTGNPPNDTKPSMTYHALIYGGSVTSCQSYQISPIIIMCGGKSIIGKDNYPSVLLVQSLPVINVTFTETSNSNQTAITCNGIGPNAVRCDTIVNNGQHNNQSGYLNVTYRTGIIFSCSNDDYVDGYHVATSAMSQPSYGYQCAMNDTPPYISHYIGLGHYCQLKNQDDTMSWSLSDNVVIENGAKLVKQCESPSATYVGSYYDASSGSKLKGNNNSVSSFDFCYQSSNATIVSCIDEENSNCNEDENITDASASVELVGMNTTDAFNKCETPLLNEETIANLTVLLRDIISSRDNITLP